MIWVFIQIVRTLPIDVSSALAGKLASTIGPLLPITRQAFDNFTLAFPDKNKSDVNKAMREMWSNIGRTAAETPNLDRFCSYGEDRRVVVEGGEHVDALRDDDQAGIFFSGHLANWEIMPLAIAQRNCDINLVYRPANNPLVDSMILNARSISTTSHLAKGAAGGRRMVELIKQGKHLGMLVDQKQNDGIAVPFFGRNAMTAPAIARLALRYGIPLVPVSVIRTNGARFHVRFHPKLKIVGKANTEQNTYDLMLEINTFIEESIRANPPHWLWIHRRWID